MYIFFLHCLFSIESGEACQYFKVTAINSDQDNFFILLINSNIYTMLNDNSSQSAHDHIQYQVIYVFNERVF